MVYWDSLPDENLSLYPYYLSNGRFTLRKEEKSLEEPLLYFRDLSHQLNIQEVFVSSISVTSEEINKLVYQIFQLPHQLRESFLTQSLQLLLHKAAMLIAYVDEELYTFKINKTYMIENLKAIDLALLRIKYLLQLLCWQI